MKQLVLIFFLGWMSEAIGQEFKERTSVIMLDYTRPVESNVLPEIHWLVPALERSGSPEQEITIEALIDSHHALSDINVLVKSGSRSKTLKVNVSGTEFSKDVTLRVPLFEGENDLILSITNSKGGRVSSSRKIKMGANTLNELMYANRKDYALIFATDRYDYWNSQVSPIADALALEEVLKFTYGFETEVVKNPTQRDITKKLAEYEARSFSSQDQLLIYFSGNCYFDRLMGFGYMVTANSLKDDPKRSTYISQSELRQSLDKFACQNILLTMDVCCADLADTKAGVDSYTTNLTQREVVDRLMQPTRKFLNTGATEYQPGTTTRRSPFTTRLLEVLQQNSSVKRVVTFAELSANFKNFDSYAGGFGRDNTAGDFVFIPK
jgi:Caspase domain